MNLLTETWRPKNREDIIGNKKSVDAIFDMVKSGKLTHLCLEGPAGCGKTSTAIAVAKTLFGEFFQSNFLELNASNDRKIETVRTIISTFAKTAPFQANFKIILLDEGDEMTPEAQNALRRIMEKYSDSCIFILTANTASKIIDPIKSRCQVFHFGPLSVEDITSRLAVIYRKEMNYGAFPDAELPALEKIAELAQGDMRKALNHLQVLLAQGPLTVEAVSETSIIDYGKLIFESLQKGRFIEARKHLWDALGLGYSSREVLSMLHKTYISEEIEFTEMKNAIFEIAETDYRLTLGVDPILALDKLLMSLIKT